MEIRNIIEDIEYLKSVYGYCPAEELLDVLKVDALRRIASALENDDLRHSRHGQGSDETIEK